MPKPMREVGIEVEIPKIGYRKWMRATHFRVDRQPDSDFLILYLALYVDGSLVDLTTLSIGKPVIEQQRENMAKFLGEIGLPEGEPPTFKAAVQADEVSEVDCFGASHGQSCEMTFSTLSLHSVAKATSKAPNSIVKVEATALAGIRCNGTLLKHLVNEVFIQVK